MALECCMVSLYYLEVKSWIGLDWLTDKSIHMKYDDAVHQVNYSQFRIASSNMLLNVPDG